MSKLSSYKFKTTNQCFKFIRKNLEKGNYNEAGDVYQQFCTEWHKSYGDYIEVYDADDPKSIPPEIIDKIDAWKLLDTGAYAYGIDKICVARSGEIDVHQDKSTLHIDVNISVRKAEALMSLRENGLTNVRSFVFNTTARGMSRYKNIWKNQPPIIFAYDNFIPKNEDEKSRDIVFWKNINNKEKKNFITEHPYKFKPRTQNQLDYVNSGIKFARAELTNSRKAKWHNIVVGAFGKSVVDPVMLSTIEKEHFDPDFTNTPKPVNISFFHSTKTLKKNGWETIQRRRAEGIYDEVIILSGTNVSDLDSGDNFFKTTDSANAVIRIKNALDRNQSVMILALYHHGNEAHIVKEKMKKFFKGFKYWSRCRDECDWPCNNPSSSFSPALDDRTESIVTFGSSGTERNGKDPKVDYGINNATIHGPCVFRFKWSQAEDAGLMKKLVLVVPKISQSEIASLFPEFVNKKGEFDWSLKVNGSRVYDDLPTAYDIAMVVSFIKSLIEFPEIKRVLGFAHSRKHNKLIAENFMYVLGKMYKKNTSVYKKLSELYWTIMNDDSDSTEPKDHNLAIKKAKAKDFYAICSSRLFSRGYDDEYSPIHHAGIHWGPRNIVDATQEVWRFCRIDPKFPNEKFAFYIAPVIYNDLDKTPHWSEERNNLLHNIIKNNKNISLEFESIVQTPGKRRKQQSRNTRIWIPEDFDPESFSDLVTVCASRARGDAYTGVAERAHNWILKEFLQLDIINQYSTSDIYKKFVNTEDAKILLDTYKVSPDKVFGWVQRFWSGKQHMGSLHLKNVYAENKLELYQHKQNIENMKTHTFKKINKRTLELVPKLLWPDGNFSNIMTDIIHKEFSSNYLTTGAIQRYGIKPARDVWWGNHAHYRKQLHKFYEIACEVIPQCLSDDEIWERIVDRWDETGILKPLRNGDENSINKSLRGTIGKMFHDNKYGFMTKKEEEHFRKIKKEVLTSEEFYKTIVDKREKSYQKKGGRPTNSFLRKSVTSIPHNKTYDSLTEFYNEVGVAFGDKHKAYPHLYFYTDKPYKGKEPTEIIWNTPYGKCPHRFKSEAFKLWETGVSLNYRNHKYFAGWFKDMQESNPNEYYTSVEPKTDWSVSGIKKFKLKKVA